MLLLVMFQLLLSIILNGVKYNLLIQNLWVVRKSVITKFVGIQETSQY